MEQNTGKRTTRKHPPFAEIAKSGAPEKSEATSEFKRVGHPPKRKAPARCPSCLRMNRRYEIRKEQKHGKEQPENTYPSRQECDGLPPGREEWGTRKI